MDKLIPSPALEFYQELEEWALESIRASQGSIALMAEIRERYGEDWQIEELTRAIMFDELQIIEGMKGETEYARTSHKKLERV